MWQQKKKKWLVLSVPLVAFVLAVAFVVDIEVGVAVASIGK